MNVKYEVWHLNWADFTSHITGPQEVISIVKTYFEKKSWTKAGLNDPKNTFGPTEEEVTALASL